MTIFFNGLVVVFSLNKSTIFICGSLLLPHKLYPVYFYTLFQISPLFFSVRCNPKLKSQLNERNNHYTFTLVILIIEYNQLVVHYGCLPMFPQVGFPYLFILLSFLSPTVIMNKGKSKEISLIFMCAKN